MLIRLLRWILGYVKFSYNGGFKENFLNDCYSKGINLKNISTSDDGICAEASIKVYKKLHKIALVHGGRVKIHKKIGLPFKLHPLNNRWGMLAGAVYFIVFISFMGGFIWNITVTGNNRVTEVKIVDYLASNGFLIGVRWNDVDKERLEDIILTEFDDIAWISINKLGSTASIEINETVKPPSVIENNITNVRASADGVIVSITALGGWAEAAVGDAVVAGDLLISGVRESEVDKKNHYAHAHGTVLAQVNNELTVTVSRNQNEKVYTQSTDYHSLFAYGAELPLYLEKDTSSADEFTQKTYLVMNSCRLPIGFTTDTVRHYYVKTNVLTDEELEALARAELEKKKSAELDGCEILAEDIQIEITDADCVITANYNYICDIGIESEILFDEQ